jgi:hypothetical protein
VGCRWRVVLGAAVIMAWFLSLPGFLEEPVDLAGDDPTATVFAADEIVWPEETEMGGGPELGRRHRTVGLTPLGVEPFALLSIFLLRALLCGALLRGGIRMLRDPRVPRLMESWGTHGRRGVRGRR